jgi:cell division transport system permease protein
MIRSLRRALQDMNDNRFLNGVAMLTVALSVLMAGAFSLIWTNASHWMRISETNIRILVYLKDGTTDTLRQEIQYSIQGMEGTQNVNFIPRSQALESLRTQLRQQASLLDGLVDNPLPDALEVTMKTGQVKLVESLAGQINNLPAVDSVEYGQQWMGRFAGLLNLFHFTGVILGGLFFIASGLIIANTARLALYSRREEVEIMRLIGATDSFITSPFYIQSLIQSTCGCSIGLSVIYAAYTYMAARLTGELTSGFWQIRFISIESIAVIVGCSIGVGWIGCFLSMKQFFRN